MTGDLLTPDLDETRRLATLDALALVGSGPERELDALVALAADVLDCPTALLNLVGRDHAWVKASNVPAPASLPRATALCDHTIRCSGLMVVDDLSLDGRFAANPLVSDGGVRFYAGAPLHAPDGEGGRYAVGTLCVLDETPRSLSERERGALLHLATLAEALIAVRATARRAVTIARTSAEQALELARKDRTVRQAERMAMIGSWRLSLADETIEWSDNVFRIHGLPVGTPPALNAALDHYPPEARGRVAALLAQAIEAGGAFDFEEDFITADAERRRVRCMGEAELLDGRPVAMVGVFQDVTRQHALETTLRRSADTDPLTGLANRAAFERRLEAAMGRARAGGSPLLLVLIDLDGFKAINDTLGHLAGDDVLREVGRALRAPWLGDSCAARLGGDEFALVVEDAAHTAEPEALARALDEALHIPARVGGLSMIAAGTVGHCAFHAELHTVRDFVHCADEALYAAKRERIGDRRSEARRRADREEVGRRRSVRLAG